MFTLKSKEGCRRILYLCICVILISSLIACLFSGDFGKVKIEKITIDVRGASLNGLLYYPSGTNSNDKLPAVVFAHGGGCTYGPYRTISEEIARRGFAVFSVSTYGAGLSELPMYDEMGMGIEQGNSLSTAYRTVAAGYWDATEYMRELEFVDPTRIAVVGHSAGGIKVGNATALDCGYLTFNDIMINVLYNEFGQSFTAEEIYKDADLLAEERLNEDQLILYKHIREEKYEHFNTRIKSVIMIGIANASVFGSQTVTVAGYDVERGVASNVASVGGWYQGGIENLVNGKTDTFAASGGLKLNEWYSVDFDTVSNKTLGQIGNVSILDSEELRVAIENRLTRLVVSTGKHTHSKDYFSKDVPSDVCRVLEQTLGYNGGDLGSPSAKPVSSDSVISLWRAHFNLIAMVAMWVMLVPLTKLLLTTKFFAPCKVECPRRTQKYDKKMFWLFSFITVAYTFLAIWKTNVNARALKAGAVWSASKWFPLFTSGWHPTVLLLWLCMGIAFWLALRVILDKKHGEELGFKYLNINIGFKNIMKTLLLAFLLIAAGYFMLATIEYLFNQDFRFWQVMYTQVRLDSWGTVFRYAIMYVPLFFFVAIALNYSVREDIPEWKDTLITVVVNSIAIWGLCAVTLFVLSRSEVGESYKYISQWETCYGQNLYLPLLVYFNRKMYKETKSVWLGAFLNSFLVAWSVVSATGSCGAYTGITFIERLLGF